MSFSLSGFLSPGTPFLSRGEDSESPLPSSPRARGGGGVVDIVSVY